MTNVVGCYDDATDSTEKSVQLQLLQLNEEMKVEVTTCSVSISSIVCYFGMNSHVSMVMGGFAEFVLDLKERSCLQLYDTGSVALITIISLNGLEREVTISRPVVLAGMICPFGICRGSTFSDQFCRDDYVTIMRIHPKKGR
ncbi:hypothetical protein Q1695_014655 [Nippostrongylus brasiliensis]|nr:hypothetical protein Q1695_014655 [Nippostrongylus brasiliensis]